MIRSASVPPSPKSLLRGIVDYAGLFPPASLSMSAAIEQYAEHRGGDESWMLGRFVVPAARLEEFEDAGGGVLPTHAALSWALSALLGSDLEEDIGRINAFNDRHRDPERGAVIVDTVELKANTPREIARAGELLDRQYDTYMEVPIQDDPGALIAAIAKTTAKAKIRTGGVTREAFPSAEHVVRFIARCLEHRVSFKATAGLHHPWAGEYPLTYATDAPSGAMFGFLNVVAATAAIHAGWTESDAARLLVEHGQGTVSIGAAGLRWRDHALSGEALLAARESMTSFGSCSFTEPVDGLRAGSFL